MHRAWLIVALLLPGCFASSAVSPDSGGAPSSDAGRVLPPPTDAAPRVDAGPPPARDAGFAARCTTGEADEVRAADVLLEGQAFAATLVDRGANGCGCQPSATLEGSSLSMSLCNCCDACDCIDAGYEASVERPALPVGTHPYSVPNGELIVQVVPRAACTPTSVTALQVVGPSSQFRDGGPRLWWVRVTGESFRCCGTPRVAIESTPGNATTFLGAFDCGPQDDCACIPETPPRVWTQWHSLGELPTGSYRLATGGVTASFEVP